MTLRLRSRSALTALALGAALLAPAASAVAAPASLAPTLTIHARYVPGDHNIFFTGIALPKGDAMLTVLDFRLEQDQGGTWRPISTWMALITGVGARWQTNGRYRSQLMAMNEPVPAGRLRVEMMVGDNTGRTTTRVSNPVRVP
jgi:hypothetical protein